MENIVDIEQYRNSRQKFVESLKAVNTQGEILVPNIRRQEKEQYIPKDRIVQERYKTRKETKSRAAQKAKKMKKTIALIAASATIAIGGLKAYNVYKEGQKPISLEMAMENGKDLTELGINQEIVKEIEYLKIQLENSSYLESNELAKLGERINELQKNTIKTKIREATGVQEGTISLEPSKDGEPARITVGNKIYYQKDIGNILDKLLGINNEMSPNMVSYINEIATMQNVMADYENGNSTRTDLLKHYKESLNGIDKLAASEIELDDKGDLVMNTTKISEIENNKQKEDDGR